jgi:hypothetical protein
MKSRIHRAPVIRMSSQTEDDGVAIDADALLRTLQELNEPKAPPLVLRIIAFAMDYSLVIAATFMFCSLVLYPHFHPGFQEASSQFITQLQAQETGLKEQVRQYVEFQMQHERAANDVAFAHAILVWLYFALSELFLSGSTLGKKFFKLSLIDLKTLSRPTSKTIIVRNCLKTLSVIMPLLSVINFVPACFGRRRLAGHDRLSGTMVTYAYEVRSMDPLDDPNHD